MPDLRVVAVIPAKPGSEDVIRAALTTLAEASRGHQGCTAYELYESGAVPGTFVTVESWASQEDIDAHLAGEDVASAFSAAGEHLGGEIAVHPLQQVG